MSPLKRIKPAHISDAEWATMLQAERDREAAIDARLTRAQQRLLARGADDGTGRCRFCGAAIISEMVDGVEHTLHPLDVSCARPRVCSTCGTERDADLIECPRCTSDRLSVARAVAQQLTMPELQPVRRQRNRYGERDDDD